MIFGDLSLNFVFLVDKKYFKIDDSIIPLDELPKNSAFLISQ